jgi:hypothetical protein
VASPETPYLSIPTAHGDLPDTNGQISLNTRDGTLTFKLYNQNNTNGCYVDEINRTTGRILAGKAANPFANPFAKQAYADALLFVKMAQLAIDQAAWSIHKFSESPLEQRACPDVHQLLPSRVEIKAAINRLHEPYEM